MKTVYIADDGKKFDDETECAEYEAQRKLAEAKLLFFGEEYRSVSTIDEALYVYVSDESAAKLFEELNDNAGYNQVRWFTSSGKTLKRRIVPGVYYWEERADCFELLDDKITQMENELAECREEKRMISEYVEIVLKGEK